MAVQKSKCSRAKRNRRRSQRKFETVELSYDIFSNEIHRRHFVTPKGYYKGKKILKLFKENTMVKNNAT